VEVQRAETYLANSVVWLCSTQSHTSHIRTGGGDASSFLMHSFLNLKHTLIMDELQAELPRLLSAKAEAWLIARINDKTPELAAVRKKAKIRFLTRYMNIEAAYHLEILIKSNAE